MKLNTAIRVVCFTLLLWTFSFRAAAEDFSDAIRAYLQQWLETERTNTGIVIGIVDEQGARTFSCGSPDNGSDQKVNGDTVFEIGSITKTFTGLLLQDMIERGEMKLDDPVAKYLPKSVRCPTRNGKEITLLQLATHTSGLPPIPDNLDPKRADNPFADYRVDKLYAFLSRYKLTRDPGAEYRYSNLGMGLLGHLIALKAGTNYQSLVVERICRPLKMDSTRIALTPELRSRLSMGHNAFGYSTPSLEDPILCGASALRSTANDMLKYVSANLDLTPTSLTLLMKKTHLTHLQRSENTGVGLAWNLEGANIISHMGTTQGFFTFIGFDKRRRRGVVVLCNTVGVFPVLGLGHFLLESEWRPELRPREAKSNSQVIDSCVGQYRRLSDVSPWTLKMRQLYVNVAEGFLPFLPSLASSRAVGGSSEPGIGIRREGDRLFAQATGWGGLPVDAFFSPDDGELLPESENRFFDRLNGKAISFSPDPQGNVNRLTVRSQGQVFSYEKISDQPPAVPKPPEPPRVAAAIKPDTKLLDELVGRYEFATNAAFSATATLAVWREGDQLLGQFGGGDAVEGVFDLYRESDTNFFLKINGAELAFIKNSEGQVTTVIRHSYGARLPDSKGRKIK